MSSDKWACGTCGSTHRCPDAWHWWPTNTAPATEREFEDALSRFENARMTLDAEWDSSTAEERSARRRLLADSRRDVLALYRAAATPASEMSHCRDCCCARIWAAMGITKYTGRDIVEHVEELVARAAIAREGTPTTKGEE